MRERSVSSHTGNIERKHSSTSPIFHVSVPMTDALDFSL